MAELNLGLLAPNSTWGFTDSVDGTDLVDTYHFTINAPTNFNLLLTGMTEDVNVELFQDVNDNHIIDVGDGAAIASSSHTSSADDFINNRLTTSGGYIVRINREGQGDTNYTLKMSNTGNSPGNLLSKEINAGILSTAPFVHTDSVDTGDTVDVYRFTLDTTGNFNASLTGITDGRNVNMRLIQDSNNNKIIDANDVLVLANAGGNHDDAINVRSLEAGNYFLQAFRVSGASSDYTLRLSNAGASGAAPGNLLATEYDVGRLTANPHRETNHLSTDDASDTYRFTLSRDGNFNATVTKITKGNDIDIRLIEDVNSNGIVDDGDELVRASSRKNQDDAINVSSLKAGNYILQSFLVSGSDSDYTLRVSNGLSNLLSDEIDAGKLSATPFTKSGRLRANNAADTYRFRMNAAGNFNAALTDMPADEKFNLRLIRDVNRNNVVDARDVVVSTLDADTVDDAINVRSLAAGQYFLQAYRQEGPGGSYTLKMSNTGPGGKSPSNLLATEFDVGDLKRAPSTYSHTLGTTNASDTYRFTLGAKGDLSAVLTGIEAGNNINLSLIRDENGNGIVDQGERIVQSSSSGRRDDALNAKLLDAGSYILQTYLVSGTDSDYTLKLSNGFSNLLSGETVAGTLGVAPFSQSGSLGMTNTSDTYRFTMESAGNFNAALTGITAGNDYDVRLIRDANSNGVVDADEMLALASTEGNRAEAINMRSLAAGDYFLQVLRMAGNDGSYDLKMSNTGNGGNTPSNLLPTEVNVGRLTGPISRTGELGVDDAADTFRFSLASRHSISLILSDLSVNANLRLIRDGNNNGIVDPGEVLKQSSITGTGNDNITRTLAAGNYIAQVYLFPTTGNTTYTLTFA